MLSNVVTGRTRHRAQSRWFRSPILVLQIEEFYYQLPEIDNTGHVDIAGQWVQVWRDATAEDLSLVAGEPRVRI